ncbi:MAG: 3-dehydroquinate synthase [Bacteroidetes bacterium]|jgi:3-dehydroquinate synthase|nr:3-dehydroquinate synthase [Bacteroidota bacterium]
MAKNAIIAGDYSIFFEDRPFAALKAFLKKNPFSQRFILTDTNVKKHCLPLLLASVPELKSADVIVVKAGEMHKDLGSCGLVWDALTKSNADRNALLINLGGGVVSDLGGFCASVYKRGIAFINLPTTLLAMADASVGGKTGIDYHSFKNHIGSFCDPQAVFIYDGFCETQSSREFTNGLAEVVKAGFIADKELVEKLTQPETELRELIRNAVVIKNTIVQKDPKEKNIRKILNFGHTIGHALESFYLDKKGKQLLHGEAIAIGMICESWIAWQLGLMKEKEFEFVKASIRLLFKKVRIDKKELPAIARLAQQDKKNRNGSIRLALIGKPGKPLVDVECNEALLKRSLQYYTTT